jgi:hypothetical protein
MSERYHSASGERDKQVQAPPARSFSAAPSPRVKTVTDAHNGRNLDGQPSESLSANAARGTERYGDRDSSRERGSEGLQGLDRDRGFSAPIGTCYV